MAVNKEGSGYTFAFAIVLVVLVGATLAFTSMSLKDKIKKNVNDKKMMNILSSVGFTDKDVTRKNAAEMFEKYVVKRMSINSKGELLVEKSGAVNALDKEDPFNFDLKKQYKSDIAKLVQGLKNNPVELMKKVDALEDAKYPMYVVEKEGEMLYVMPMVGTGLWGPVWGYVSLREDCNTIYGAAFDHKGETPGLGAEIKKESFEKNFIGLKINDDKGGFVSITARKGGKLPGNEHQVDGITGGTITSNGVNEMLYRSMLVYSRYFKSK